eukprot:s758_g19.t1
MLADAATAPQDAKSFSTRFARTWREKLDSTGQQVWLRRSRFVAREFAGMQPDRDALFSPASSSIVARVLPLMFLDLTEHKEAVLAAIDVKDAFLTVAQETPMVVRCQLADGQVMDYSLGKVLPGQRDGSLLWHRAITGLLRSEVAMSEHAPYPCILKSPDGSCIVLIHVDDISVIGGKSFAVDKLIKCLEKVYSISVQLVQKPGDELQFLKRTMTLQHDGRLTVQTHFKHVQHLCELLKLNPRLQTKKTPGHSDMDQVDDNTFGTVDQHLPCRILWLQNLVLDGTVKLAAISGQQSPADIGTERLPAPRLRPLMSVLGIGMFNMETNTLEGADDLAGIFKKACAVKRQSVIAALLAP